MYTPGTKLAISGKVKLTEYGKTFVDTQIEILKDNYDNFNFSGKILPLYSLGEALSNMSFIKLMKKVLIYAKQYPEILNKKQLNSLSLLSKGEALINIHFPPTQQALIESKKRLDFDELFLLQIKFLLRKRKTNKNVTSQQLPQKKSLLKEFLNTLDSETYDEEEAKINDFSTWKIFADRVIDNRTKTINFFK